MTTPQPKAKVRPQPFLHPEGLFPEAGAGPVAFWTCVRARPRWEKKLARWLAGAGFSFYMPTFPRTTTSHRKTRTSDSPLFPGYLFVQGNLDKRDFVESQSVICVIKPTISQQVEQLHAELWNIWRGLMTGSNLEVATKLKVGQWVHVIAGPMKGVRGRFEKWGKNHRLILTVDMLSIGIALEVPDSCTVVPLEG